MAKAKNHIDITASSRTYSEDIKLKIDETRILMSNRTSEMDYILFKTDENIQLLINETIVLKRAAKDERNKLIKKEQELSTQLVLRRLLGVVNVVSQFFYLAGPSGAAAGAAVGGGAMIIEALALDDQSGTGQDKLLELPKAVSSSLPTVTNEIKHKNRLVLLQLQDVEKELKQYVKDDPNADMKKISEKIHEVKDKLNKENDKISALDIQAIRNYENVKREILTSIEQKKMEMRRETRDDAINILQTEMDSLLEKKRAASPSDLPRVNNELARIEERIKIEIKTNNDLDIELFHRKRAMQKEKDQFSELQQQKLTGKNYYEYEQSATKRQTLDSELETLIEQRIAVPKTLTDTTRELHNMEKRLRHLKEYTDAVPVSEKRELDQRKERLLKQKEHLLNERKAKVAKRVEEGTRRMETAQNYLRIVDVSIGTYSRIRNSKAKIEQVADAIEKANRKGRLLREHEQKIYDLMLPLSDTMKQAINGMETSLNGLSRVALDVRKWKMQLALRDIRAQMQELYKGFVVEESFISAFRNFEEAIGVLIQAYKDVEIYQEQNLFALYVADISKESLIKVEVKDEKLKEAMEKLNFALCANMVIKEFEMVSSALKQLVFPFASHYLELFSLPTYLQLNYSQHNISLIASSLAKKLTNIKGMITQKKTVTEGYDKYVRSDVKFQSETAPYQPFFVWRNDKNNYAISNFLDGINVNLFADISEGMAKNAIKFKEIGILLKTANITEQLNLDEMLSPRYEHLLEVSMTHNGISAYRCGSKFYTLTNKPHTFRYIYHPDGTKSNPNEIVKKVKNGSPMLSPYTMWRIQLTGIIPSGLKKFKNKINIELIGRGQYIDHMGVDDDVCNTDLDSFYELKDDTFARDDFGFMHESAFPHI